MGWRESLGDRYTADALMGLSPADRIALARELLEGTERFVAKPHTQVLREYPGGSRAVQTVLVADYPDATSENTT